MYLFRGTLEFVIVVMGKLLKASTYDQRIIDMNRNGNFCKATRVSKVIAKNKVDARVDKQKKSTGFSRMSVMANLLCFGCFAAG